MSLDPRLHLLLNLMYVFEIVRFEMLLLVIRPSHESGIILG